MSTSPPSFYQQSFYQRMPALELRGLDLVAKRYVGKWRRRGSVIRPWRRVVSQVEALMPELVELSDGMLNQRLLQAKATVTSESEEVDPEVLAVICEVSRRELKMTPYSVQILSAIALISGYLAEIDTGEGKTLSIALATVYEAWKGEPVHVITANDYLAVRDAKTMRPFYQRLQVSVGTVVGETEPSERREGYQHMVTYTTAKEVAADYLRDRLVIKEWDRSGQRQHFRRYAKAPDGRIQLVQRGLFRAIIDEADNGLIDEAVTPLLISQKQTEKDLDEACQAAWFIAEKMREGIDYKMKPGERLITITEKGEDTAETYGGFPESPLWRCPDRCLQMIKLALEAKEYFDLGTHYIISEGKIVIVDDSTGRPMPDRSWKLGLHQMVEAKEGVTLTEPSQTIAQISFQAFFQRYGKLSGATGTAREIADEVWTTYNLSTVRIPRNKPNISTRRAPVFFATESDKEQAVLADILQRRAKGQPLLAGTRSVTSSERLAKKLGLKNVDCEVLNATRLSKEAGIVSGAGSQNKVTIATNMAGRGTDIELGYGVVELGGLHVIATEPHESRRVDRQLYGRSGRQGDPGSVARFYSLDDELFERFLPKVIHRFLGKVIDSEGRSRANLLCRLFLIYVQSRAEKLASHRRLQVARNDESIRSSLGFADER